MIIPCSKSLDRCRMPGFCELCLVQWCRRREPHHVFKRGRGFRNDLAINLLAVGGAAECNCHGKAENGQISKERCLEVIAVREGLELDVLKTVLQRLRHA